MITNNGINLLKGTIQEQQSGSTWIGTIVNTTTGLKYTDSNGTQFDRFGSGIPSTIGNSMGAAWLLAMQAMFNGALMYGGLTYKAKTVVPTSGGGRYFTATYDSGDTPVSPDMYQVPGDNLSTGQTASDSVSANIVHTITFANNSDTVMHCNRIGLYTSGGNGASQSGVAILTHIIPIDDIALKPGETKSITLTIEL